MVLLVDAFQCGKLAFVVYACGKVVGAHGQGLHGYAVGGGEGDGVGEVVFALGVGVLQGVEPA